MHTIDLNALRDGNRRSLAKAITLIESSRADDREAAQSMLEELLPGTGNSIRIGISGVPGVGKSTFIEAFGLYLAEQNHNVAVLAVDPSSPLAGGSILGDKTRMELLSRHPQAFIRPSPSSGALGGVAQKTRETILLCEAAGFNIILVETVGVGQSEYDVASMVDFFLLLMIPNAGDELQGIKKGIMELVDALVINKADGESKGMAQQSRQHYQNALHLLRSNEHWDPQVLTCSALHSEGIDAVWRMIESYIAKMRQFDAFEQKRSEQNLAWMKKLMSEVVDWRIKNNPDIERVRKTMEAEVVAGTTTPYAAAIKVIENL